MPSSPARRTIGILTGGGDVPGLNPAIRSITLRALAEGYRVLGIRRGWAGLVEIDPGDAAGPGAQVVELTETLVNQVGRSGGTFLHTSRTRPSHIPAAAVPPHLRDRYAAETNDLTPTVLENLERLGIDLLIPIGGDDTLGYAVRLHEAGVPVIGIPKTMDNDVPGTDYCIGFGTCVTRTIALVNALRTSASSHERFLVVEVFGRYAGFTALLPTLAGAADRCVIPEQRFDIERLCALMSEDRTRNPERYAIVLVSEGAAFEGGMVFEDEATDMFGHKKLGGIGERVGDALKELSPRFNQGRSVHVINQRLGYLVRSGDPDALDSIVPTAFGTLAMDLVLRGEHGRMVCLCAGRYEHVPIETVTAHKKQVDVAALYNTERLRPEFRAWSDHRALFALSAPV